MIKGCGEDVVENGGWVGRYMGVGTEGVWIDARVCGL